MSQDPDAKPLSENLGYVVKQASTALNSAMDAALRPCRLTVSQYSCLELLSREPDQTNAQLARGAFVTPQSMNEVLRGLERRGLVAQSPVTSGRARPTHLTEAGEQLVNQARSALRPVEEAMQTVATPLVQQVLLDGLRDMIATLTHREGAATTTQKPTEVNDLANPNPIGPAS